MAIGTNAGFSLGVSSITTRPADNAAYDALTFVNVGEVASMGPLGDTFNIVSEPDGTGRVEHTKGAVDGGQIPVTVRFRQDADPGYAVIKTLAASRSLEGAFKVTLADASFYYFVARVGDLMTSNIDSDTNDGASFTLYRNTALDGPNTS